MKLTIYNTLTKNKEEFKSIVPGMVSIYVCGPTVYGDPHLGHAKSYVFFDTLIRFLRYIGYEVKYVQNITDVGHLVSDADDGEDKIQKKAKLEKTDPMAIAYHYENVYFDMMDKLNIKKPSISSRATGHIIEMQEMIKILIDKDYAYITDEGNVYYDVAKFSDYGKLSNRTLEETLSGERITVSTDKRNPQDFALWKKADESHIMKWPSPWSVGFPGWHIECSVMSKKYLGATFDIHGGGMDNVFPHHECEIAQSEIANDAKYVNYFIHNNLVTVNGQKMGKSLGNFITLEELFKKYSPMVVRFYLETTHYRKPTDFTDEKLKESEAWYNKINKALSEARKLADNYEITETDKNLEELKNKFIEAMLDDINTALAISFVYEFSNILIKEINGEKDLNKIQYILNFFDNEVLNILGIRFEEETNSEDSQKYIDYIVDIREELRKEKNFILSDKIRDDMKKMNVDINDRKANN